MAIKTVKEKLQAVKTALVNDPNQTNPANQHSKHMTELLEAIVSELEEQRRDIDACCDKGKKDASK
jgi:hypothetical protein